MKKALLLIAMATMAVAANAQLSLKPMGGVNFANLRDYPDNGKMRVAIFAGGEFEYKFAHNMGVSAGLLYSMQGNNASYTETVTGMGTEVKYATELEYINIPILFNYYIADGFAIKLGVQPGFLTKADSNTKTTVYHTDGHVAIEGGKNDVKDAFETFDFSIPVGLSYEFKGGFTIDARYNFGLTKVNKNEIEDPVTKQKTDTKVKNSVFMLGIGYKFAL